MYWTISISYGLLCLILSVLLGSCAGRNDDGSFPTRNMTIIVPFKPGGGFDLQARLLAPFLEKYLPNKVHVVIENISGAGGKMAAVQLARSRPDGYTIGLIGLESIAFMRAMGQLTDDPQNWSWLGQLGSEPLLVAATSGSGLQSPADMKTKNFRFGVTSEMVPSAAILCKALGARFQPVHFDGSGEVVLAAIRGDVDVWVFSWPTAVRGVRDSQGKMVSLFVLNQTRLSSIPEVPTLAELGIEAEAGVYAVGGVSRVIAAPPGLDAKIREILISAIDSAVRAFISRSLPSASRQYRPCPFASSDNLPTGSCSIQSPLPTDFPRRFTFSQVCSRAALARVRVTTNATFCESRTRAKAARLHTRFGTYGTSIKLMRNSG